MLRFPPIKSEKIPDMLIHDSCNKEFGTHSCTIFSTKKKSSYAKAKYHFSDGVFYYDQKTPIIFVDKLVSYDRNKGLGTGIIKYLKNLSNKKGCDGRIVLYSSSCYTPQKIPHIFYRKLGFTTENKKYDKILDKAIRKRKNLTHNDMIDILMVYEPKTKKMPKWKKFLNLIFGRKK